MDGGWRYRSSRATEEAVLLSLAIRLAIGKVKVLACRGSIAIFTRGYHVEGHGKAIAEGWVVRWGNRTGPVRRRRLDGNVLHIGRRSSDALDL